jgi:dienelactone hydrolase
MTGMRERRKWRWRIVAGVVALAAVVAWIAAPYMRSAALLMDMTGAAPGLRRWLPARTFAIATQDLDVPAASGAIPSRIYRAVGHTGPTLVVFPGVHGGGLDEPRLVALSRRIAAAGATVLSVPIPELRTYHLTGHATDSMESVIRWTAANRALSPTGRVGVVGVSFAGGLALVAVGRPGVSELVTAVFALGAHADLPRVIRYLCLDPAADQTLPKPHDYGAALMLRASVPLLVPPDQIAALDRAVAIFLNASSAESTNAVEAQRLFADARAAESQLPEPARSLMHGVNERNLAAFGPRLAPFAESVGGDPALSPTRSPPARTRVFLLHGDHDNVVPASESTALQRYLTESGNTHVELLLTPLLSHANAAPTDNIADTARLIAFWTRLWRALSEQ